MRGPSNADTGGPSQPGNPSLRLTHPLLLLLLQLQLQSGVGMVKRTFGYRTDRTWTAPVISKPLRQPPRLGPVGLNSALNVLSLAEQLQHRRSGTARRLLSSAIAPPYALQACRATVLRQGERECVLGLPWLVATVRNAFCVRRVLVPSSPPLVVVESPSYHSRLSSYTQTLPADTLVYLALRVTGR